ncbi:unnamed protein product [Litomosoides sigmodontis]|uniref:BHLH domain-containing protein n=1 Tax=Litomosoides sigmodontis TaxID=42156 RepID=A0A3P6SUF0_LITSI|nr:unnamed protein product [Litomosoides sigmodontis]
MMTSPYASPSPPQYPLERKLKKPLMEKRRRARMNECLDQLKHLLLHISPNHRTKLEKADILEMTVAYLNQMQHPPSPSTSFDNNAIYQQSYTEGFTVAASACLTYLQNILPPSEFASQAQQFRLGLIQHLQSVMSSHMNGCSGEDSAPVPVPSRFPANFQPRSPSAGTYLPPNYLPNATYLRTPCIAYQPNISGLYATPMPHTAVSAPSQSNVSSTSKDLVPRSAAVVNAHPTYDRREKCFGYSKSAAGSETKGISNGVKGVKTIRDVKVWRPF